MDYQDSFTPQVGNYTPDNLYPKESKKRVKNECWKFSFRFWKQVKFFGLDRTSSEWFVSFLEKLKELSGKERDLFTKEAAEKEAWRYHNIDWGLKNVPIKRSDLNWIDSTYLNNDVEFPLMQFQVSKALGRIVGFWDENKTFNIVLLDPLHNIQPSGLHNYRVDDCYPLSCEYSSLLSDVEELKNINPCKEECKYYEQLSIIPKKNRTNVLISFLEETKIHEINEIISEGKADNLLDIIETGLCTLICKED